MPPPPSFDYYDELEVERSASLTEITSAYRRLARIHHPDKNPGNQQEATATFQRLQLAHETLSDPVKRDRYDDEADVDILYEAESFDSDSSPFAFPFEFFSFFRMSRTARRVAAQAAERKRQEQEAEKKREEQRQRQEAKEAREKEANMRAALAKRRLLDEELEKQEKRWEEMGAVSEDEKLKSCLHSELCDKVQHSRKFKCTACSVKRGMTAFECPHCSSSLCMLCIKNFSERRKRMETKEQMTGSDVAENSPGTNGEPLSNEPDANDPNINEININEINANEKNANENKKDSSEPTNGAPAVKKPKKKRAKTKTTNTDGSSEQTRVSSKSGEIHKNDRPVLSEETRDQASPTSGTQFASENPYKVLTKDDLATASEGLAHSSKTERTGGHIRTLKKMSMPSAATLRTAMEKFGTVRSLKITNKKYGVAHIDFASHDGLCRAMAASPVFVTETVDVRVVELRRCHTCGKDGHNAENCWATPTKTQAAA
ncbi:DnaJ domain-containing protein [Diaporthe helianthi]|uniref:DnaJ domain-containing protein n=1 Tax=Diaporthe helianthi TaxID=158607 RepID=A0A2P5HFX4_DIAHE|nr:DnaJ domain-containing protein [Diaporthe helianthi]